MDIRLSGHRNLAREFNFSTVSYLLPSPTDATSKFYFYYLMAYPFIPPPPSKKGSFPPPPPILFKFQPFLRGVVVVGGLCGGALFLYYHRDKVSTLLISIIAILI